MKSLGEEVEEVVSTAEEKVAAEVVILLQLPHVQVEVLLQPHVDEDIEGVAIDVEGDVLANILPFLRNSTTSASKLLMGSFCVKSEGESSE